MKLIEKHSRARRYIGAAALASLIAAPVLLGAGCGGVASQPPAVGGESHFLEKCDGLCGDGLDCIGGVCTRGCLVSELASCSQFPNAACTAESVEPGAVAVCDVACSRDADCSELGSAHRCEAGYCRAPNRGNGGMGGTSTGTSGSSGMGMGGTSIGTGGVAGSEIVGTAMGGMVDCNLYRPVSDPPQLEIVVRNERSAPIYVPQVVETYCSGYPIRVRRNEVFVDISSGGCGLSCERVQEEGATSPGSTATACIAKCIPAPLVLIGPGEEQRYRIDALEVAFLDMPNACFSGDFESVTCFTRIGLPPSEYEVSLAGFTEFTCSPLFTPCECLPDAEGVCQDEVYQGAGETLTATTSFTRPSPENMIDISLTTVTLTFGP